MKQNQKNYREINETKNLFLNQDMYKLLARLIRKKKKKKH